MTNIENRYRQLDERRTALSQRANHEVRRNREYYWWLIHVMNAYGAVIHELLDRMVVSRDIELTDDEIDAQDERIIQGAFWDPRYLDVMHADDLDLYGAYLEHVNDTRRLARVRDEWDRRNGLA